MLVPGLKVLKKWTKRNMEWYVSKGYDFTNYMDELYVCAEDLSKGAGDIVEVQCDYCGEINNVVWRDYYKRMDYGKYACKKCRLKKASETTLNDRQDSLYSRAKEFCDKYKYIIVTPKEEIRCADDRVDYICPKHGVHNTKIYTLITGHKCVDCMHEIGASNQKLDIQYIMNYFETYDTKWLNPEDYINSTTKNLTVICPDCGQPYKTSFFAFKKHGWQRCPDCSNLESKGEHEVRIYLEKNSISFIPLYRFYDCRTTVPLPFDFYLDELNIAIEYDGAGHYQPIRRGGMTAKDAVIALEKILYRDSIKTNYCNKKGIKLIRIPYWNFNDIEIILDEQLLNLHKDIV